MAKGFFENFPTMVYDNDGKGQYKEVVDIFRRVSLRNNLKNYIQMPLLQSIDGTQKPERLANLVHGDPKRNWLVMMMNNIENPYTDWFMSEEEFYKYMLEKYPNKFIQLVDGHVSTSIYLPGETLLGFDATVVKFDATLKTIVYTGQDIAAPPIPEGNNPVVPVPIEGNTSGATGGTIVASSSEFNAPHHESGYVLTEGDPIVGTTKPDGINFYVIGDVYRSEITNWDYENNLNEAKSQVSVLNNDYIDRIEDEFKKRIT